MLSTVAAFICQDPGGPGGNFVHSIYKAPELGAVHFATLSTATERDARAALLDIAWEETGSAAC